MSRFVKFYFTSSMLNMFRILIYPSSGACDFSVVSPHLLCVLVWMCVGVPVWLGWGQPATRIRDICTRNGMGKTDGAINFQPSYSRKQPMVRSQVQTAF